MTSSTPDLPRLSYFLETSTHDMQRDAIRAYGLQCYRLAMERAAQMCDEKATRINSTWIAKDIAAAIRALAQQEMKK